MPRPLLIFSQSDYLIQVVDINSHTQWQTVQIQIVGFFQLIWIYTVCKGRTRVKSLFTWRIKTFYRVELKVDDWDEHWNSKRASEDLHCIDSNSGYGKLIPLCNSLGIIKENLYIALCVWIYLKLFGFQCYVQWEKWSEGENCFLVLDNLIKHF